MERDRKDIDGKREMYRQCKLTDSVDQGVLRNQFRIETTETGTETSFGTI